jgi:hypothetical protein
MTDTRHCRQIPTSNEPIVVCERERLLAEIEQLQAEIERLRSVQ